MVFVARDNDMGVTKKKKDHGNAKQWEGYDQTDRDQADMEKGIKPKRK